nr:Nif3-like dinuclear metal center hexameric protein [Tissierella sp.]
MFKLKEIINFMENWAPSNLIDSWDNTGFQIGDPQKEINKILIALDLDNNTLKKAIEGKFDLIITHHPLIFKPVNKILTVNPDEKLIIDIIRNDISVYNAHSNLDLANGGVSDVLADKLGLKNTSILKETSQKIENEKILAYGYGRIGYRDTKDFKTFIEEIKESLDIESLIFYGNIEKEIRNVAVCGGSGSDFIEDASLKGADVYITGDIKYHEAQYAYERGLNLIDVGHFHSEKFIVPVIKGYLEEKFKTLKIEVIMEQSLPRKIY